MMREPYIPKHVELVDIQTSTSDRTAMEIAFHNAKERIQYGLLACDDQLVAEGHKSLEEAQQMRVRFTYETFLALKKSLIQSDPFMAYELDIVNLDELQDEVKRRQAVAQSNDISLS